MPRDESSSLLTVAVGSHLLIMPWVSSSYGMPPIARFTNHLTPLILVAMGMLAASLWDWIQVRPQSSAAILRPPTFAYSRDAGRVTCALLVALCLWPLVSLWRFYDHAIARARRTHINWPSLTSLCDSGTVKRFS